MRLTLDEMARRCRFTAYERAIFEAWTANESCHAHFNMIQNGLAEAAAIEQPLDPATLATMYGCPVMMITAMLKSIYVMFVLTARRRIPGYAITKKGQQVVNSESLERYIQQLPESAEEDV